MDATVEEIHLAHHADVVQVTKKGRIKGVECRCGHLSLALDTHERHLLTECVRATTGGPDDGRP